MGATAGRTTLTGEGLQHDDGHSHVLASTVPSVRAYDPAFAYELAAIVRDGIERMYVKGEDVFYYITIYNENYAMPAKPDGRRGGHPPRHLPLRGRAGARRRTAHGGRALVGSGSILLQVIAAQALLAEQFGVAAEVYRRRRSRCSAATRSTSIAGTGSIPDAKPGCRTSPTVLGAEGRPDRRRVRLDEGAAGPRAAVARPPFVALGTDGFGRSDTRETLRALFEIDAAEHRRRRAVGLARRGAIAGQAAAEGDRASSASTRRRPTRSPSEPWGASDETHDRCEGHGPGRDRPRCRRRPARGRRHPPDRRRGPDQGGRGRDDGPWRADQLGIDRSDMRTASLVVQPEYDYKDGVQQLRGQSVTHQYLVTVRDLDRSAVSSTTASRRRDQLDGVAFRTADPAAADAAARVEAYRDAGRGPGARRRGRRPARPSSSPIAEARRPPGCPARSRSARPG